MNKILCMLILLSVAGSAEAAVLAYDSTGGNCPQDVNVTVEELNSEYAYVVVQMGGWNFMSGDSTQRDCVCSAWEAGMDYDEQIACTDTLSIETEAGYYGSWGTAYDSYADSGWSGHRCTGTTTCTNSTDDEFLCESIFSGIGLTVNVYINDTFQYAITGGDTDYVDGFFHGLQPGNWSWSVTNDAINFRRMRAFDYLIHVGVDGNLTLELETSTSFVYKGFNEGITYDNSPVCYAAASIQNSTGGGWCSVDADCPPNFYCLDGQCVLESLQTYNISGYVSNQNGVSVSNANLLFSAKSFPYNFSVNTDSFGFYEATIAADAYFVYVNKSGYGTTVDSDFVHSWEQEANWTLFNYNLNFTVYEAFNMSKPLGNVTVTATDAADPSSYFTRTTGSDGNARLLVKEGPETDYNIVLSKTGYDDTLVSVTDWLYGYDYDYPTHINRLAYMIPGDTSDIQVEIRVNDVLTTDTIENATVLVYDLDAFTNASCAAYASKEYSDILTTDSDGKAWINLTRGPYYFEVYANGYLVNSAGNCKNILASPTTLLFNMIADITQWPTYTVNGTTTFDGTAKATPVYISCRANDLDASTIHETVSNSSGFYEIAGVYYQSVCRFFIMDPMTGEKKLITEQLITSNRTVDLAYDTTYPYSVYVGNYMTAERILGSSITVYENCNSTYQSCTLHSLRHDNDPTSLPIYYFEDGDYVVIKVEKDGYLTGWDNFTTNLSDSLTNKVRVITLVPEGLDGGCIIRTLITSDVYFEPSVQMWAEVHYRDNESSSLVAAEVTPEMADTVFYDPGVLIEKNLECDKCYTVDIDIVGKFVSIGGDWYAWELPGIVTDWPDDINYNTRVVGSRSVVLCTDDYFTFANLSTDLKVPPGFGSDADMAGTDFDPNRAVYNDVMGPMSEDSLFGMIGRLILRIFGYNEDLSIFLIIEGIAVVAVFSVLFVPTVLIWIGFYNTVFGRRGQRSASRRIR